MGTIRATEHRVETYDPPKDDWQFPTVVCEKWSVVTTVTTESVITTMGDTEHQESTSKKTFRYECLRTEEITVPAGKFNTFVIRSEEEPAEEGETSEEEAYQFDGYGIQYYSPEVGFFVRDERYDDDGNLIGIIYLNRYEKGSGRQDVAEDGAGETELPLGFEITFVHLAVGIVIVFTIIGALAGILRYRTKRAMEKYRLELERIETLAPGALDAVPGKHWRGTEPTVRCSKCNATLRIPTDKRPIVIRCPSCRNETVLND
jgi:hypothetical protein